MRGAQHLGFQGGECVQEIGDVQEVPSNPSLDELHAEDAARDSVKDDEADDSMEDAKKVADLSA